MRGSMNRRIVMKKKNVLFLIMTVVLVFVIGIYCWMHSVQKEKTITEKRIENPEFEYGDTYIYYADEEEAGGAR